MDALYTQSIVGAAMPTSGTINPADWFVEFIQGGTQNDSGVTINGRTVLSSGPVFQAVSIISGDIAQLPLHLYRRDADGNKQREERHAAFYVLNVEPHALISPTVFRQTMQSWALIWGNAVAAIERNNRNEPTALVPLRPDKVWVDYDSDKTLWYYYADDGVYMALKPSDVVHIRGLGDSLWGYSLLDIASNSFGHNLALQRYGNKHFGNGSRPAGVLQLDGRMSAEDRQTLRREWNDAHQGLDNAHKIAILQQGMKFQQTTIPNDAAQFLESREFSRDDIASWFKLPPHKLGSMKNSSVRANLEEQNRDYINQCLGPWFRVWEDELCRKLFTQQQKRSRVLYFKFNTNAFLRGSLEARMNAYAVGRQWGIWSVNEIRDLEDMNNIGPAGDVYLHPLNMVDAETGEQMGDEKSETQEPPSDSPNMAAVHVVARSAADRMCRQEAECLRRCAKKENYVEAVEEFYAGWESTLAGALRPAVDVAMVCRVETADAARVVKTYCQDAKQSALALADSVRTFDELYQAVDGYVAGWETAAATLTKNFLGGDHEIVSDCSWL